MKPSVPPRSEVAVEYTWDARSVFPSDLAWEEAFQAVEKQLPLLAEYQGHLGDSPARLADWLSAVEIMIRDVMQVWVYAGLLYQVNTADQEAAARHDRARTLFARAMSAIAFGEPEIVAIGFDTLKQWLQDEPRLAIYAHYLDQLQRRQQHVLSPEIESLLSQASDVFRSGTATHGILAQAELQFRPARGSEPEAEPIEVTNGNIRALLSDPDREVRRTAWESYADAHLAFKNTMANCLSAGIKQHVFVARTRRYDSALQAALDQTNIPEAVYRNTLATFRRHLPTWHRYWRLRRQSFRYDNFHVYDIAAPLTAEKPAVPFAQAVDWIVAGMAPLGEEYVAVMRRGLLEQRWVDVYPNQGKSAGAFSYGAPGTHPFILTNYNDDMVSMSVLAHELGHSMHSYYTWQTQPIIYSSYGIFLAEVASNFNQALVRDYLLRHSSDRDFQVAVIEEALANFYRYFFLMPTLARFELEIHERVERGEALTADSLSGLMTDLFREAYGGEVELDEDRVGITWAQFHTHLYANFYVYQYATGLAGAHALAADVMAGKAGAVDRYLAFLKAGGSDYPLNILKAAGVDLATPEPMEKTFALLAQMVDRLEQLIGGD
ncbi:MAG TPA: oligoendopeptidase F [Anaerolineae bacterium]